MTADDSIQCSVEGKNNIYNYDLKQNDNIQTYDCHAVFDNKT